MWTISLPLRSLHSNTHPAAESPERKEMQKTGPPNVSPNKSGKAIIGGENERSSFEGEFVLDLYNQYAIWVVKTK